MEMTPSITYADYESARLATGCREALPVADELLELQAALSLNKPQLARILRVTRPALYGWFQGKEPNAANSERIRTLLRVRVVRALERARDLGAAAAHSRTAREDRLRALGFEDPGDEQRKEQLARNVALQDWPRR